MVAILELTSLAVSRMEDLMLLAADLLVLHQELQVRPTQFSLVTSDSRLRNGPSSSSSNHAERLLKSESLWEKMEELRALLTSNSPLQMVQRKLWNLTDRSLTDVELDSISHNLAEVVEIEVAAVDSAVVAVASAVVVALVAIEVASEAVAALAVAVASVATEVASEAVAASAVAVASVAAVVAEVALVVTTPLKLLTRALLFLPRTNL